MDRGKLLLRPIKEDDLPAICQVAAKVGPGFTSLPNDLNLIQKKITRSLESFQALNSKESRFYFFVLEDLAQQLVIGTAAIEVSASYLHPLYNYEVATLVQRSESLKKEKQHTLLCLENNYQHASVLCTLFLDANYRGLKRGEFLSRARCLFIAEFPDLFADTFIAEMRGCFDEQGISPFWEGLGQHFFDIDFKTVNFITATQGSDIIADLMPTYPIYTCLLPKTAEEVIAKAHPHTVPAKHVLEKEGFEYRHYIDILDGGPIIEAEKNALKTLRESHKCKIVGFKPEIPGTLAMISNTEMNFKASLGVVEMMNGGEVIIEQEMAERLSVTVGDWVRFAALD